MKKLKVFISSVQTEFAKERQNLFEYLHSDSLLGFFIEPFLFGNPLAIERLGTRTGDIIRLCKEKGLKEPEFFQDEDFKSIIWRTLKTTGQVSGEPTGEPGGEATDHVTVHVTVHDADHVEDLVKGLLLILVGEMNRPEIMKMLGLKLRPNFMGNYIQPALDSNYIEMTLPDKPTSINQRYHLTPKGIALKQQLENKK